MISRTYLAAIIMLLIHCGYGQMPSYRSCANAESEKCDSLAQATFISTVINQVVAQRGYFFNDSIYFKYQVKPDGTIKITDDFYLHSGQARLLCEVALMAVDTLFAESSYNKEFPIAFVFHIPDEYESYEDAEHVEKPLSIKACQAFNEKAKRACVRYLATLTEDQLITNNQVTGEITARLYLDGGRISAIEYTKTPLDKYYNDLIYPLFEEKAEAEIDWSKARDADPQWIELEISNFKDSTTQHAYVHKKLAYLGRLKDKTDFLAAMLETGPRYYKGREKADFYMKQLAAAGLDQGKSFTSSGSVFVIDSIRNYQPEPEGNEAGDSILSFAIVETVPVYKGCDEDDDNEKLKDCFQHKILKHVGSTFNFPETARRERIQGRCYVNFVIEKDGSIGSIDVTRGAHPLLDYECIRVVSVIPDMQPAAQRGKPVRMSFTLPINAKLQ